MNLKKTGKTLCCAVFLATAFQANAAEVTLIGPDLTYTFDDSTLYGSGYLTGNSLFFSPTNFFNQSDDGTGPSIINETLNIKVTVNAGSAFEIDAIGLFETGDYILDGSSAYVSSSARTQVTSLTTTSGLFVATSIETVQTGNITSPQDGSTNSWTLTNINDFDWSGETSVMYQIQNNLIASTSSDSDLAFIQKKSGQVGIVVNPVPIPAAIWLFGSAIAVLGLTAKRKGKIAQF